MSEHKLRDAFDHMGPDEAARQRMLQNILAAHEASGAAEAQPDEEPKKQQRHRRGQFSLLRYALPMAACLIFAVLMPPVLPELVAAFEDYTSPPSNSQVSNEPSPSATQGEPPASQEPEDQQPGSQQATNQQGGSHEPNDPQSDDPQSDDSQQGDDIDTTVTGEPLPPGEDPADQTPDLDISVPTEAPAVVVPAPAAPSQAPSEPAYDLTPPPAFVVESPGVPYMAIPDPWPSPVDYVALSLSALACLAAILIAIKGIITWRRNKQK